MKKKDKIKQLFEMDPEEFREENEEQESLPPPPLPEIEELSPEDLGGLFFTEEEVRLIMDTEVTDFETSVMRGQLTAQAKIRQMVILQAGAGSGEAQKLVEKWIQRIRLDKLQ